ncbi:hypothetical protein [Pseudobacteriovorax antillogorgiicola]|uniref:PRC-barrel domain-containing protein n=1 Tax=Pseudobacteriovorax antillogorgiicola TaxID=1513793 RepID=A0A1Y6BQ89_9BACT|nr:hypothetical protein [Pseudobacteriovorax antillogorgiicola]TCS53743.1 hypothetical protein EDD56_10752 [Pseudobacteriovorax antillogorgiicola]SMF22650.1 hypothetical protein SAMN06296036_107220 [Pseudobacteriovorax antillogorgiicola]
MFIRIQDVLGKVLHAQDGVMGTVHDFLFDDETWTITHVVIACHNWVGVEKFVVEASLAGIEPHMDGIGVSVNLSKEGLHEGSIANTSGPQARQEAGSLEGFYLWRMARTIPHTGLVPGKTNVLQTSDRGLDAKLKSVRTLSSGYRAMTVDDEELGCCDDVLVNPETWKIVGMNISNRRWLPSTQDLILLPKEVRQIDQESEMLNTIEFEKPAFSQPSAQEEPNYLQSVINFYQ